MLGQYGNPGRDSALKPFGQEPLLILDGSLATLPQRHRIRKRDGIGGDLQEISSIFTACLQVGRIERAGVILKRIAKIDTMTPEQMLKYHNEYLRFAVSHILGKYSESSTQALHKWFELEIRSKGIPIDAETIGYMLKASLQSPRGIDRRNRLIRRYMDINRQKDMGTEVFELGILSAEEVNDVTHIRPEYNVGGPVLGSSLDTTEIELDDATHDTIKFAGLVPDVKPTPQKGLGLKSLKQSLSLFSEHPDSLMRLNSLSEDQKREVQSRLEMNAVESAIDRWREENAHLTKMGLNTAMQTKSLGARMWKWQLALEQNLREELIKVDEAELKENKSSADSERCQYGPFLRLLDTDRLAAVTILSTMGTLSSMGIDKGLPLSHAIMAISTAVEEEALFERIQKESKSASSISRFSQLSPSKLRRARRIHGSSFSGGNPDKQIGDEAVGEALNEESWPLAHKARVGAFLMSALVETAKIPVTMERLNAEGSKEIVTQIQPAFTHSYIFKLGQKRGVILPNKVLTAQVKREPVHSLLAKHLPMLVKPDPWTAFNRGGFISHPGKAVRIKLGDKDQKHYAEAAVNKGDMNQTFKGLDVLGKTSWRINRPVFDVILEAWNSGEAIANIPPETPQLEIPPEPAASQNPEERRRWIKAVKLRENAKSGLHSQRCFMNFQLEIARALRNHDFYYPHNIDFRGRAYPIPPYLNHMGADHCRGLLTFAKGKELGETGLRWLKIHLANVFGYDKASLKERECFAQNHIDKIYETASNPLKGSRWWLNAEDPWQFLAACMELKNALESPDPLKFVSHLPIHQDGTCNGLQHYAALGGDVWGAKQVNLEPGDRPADVYTAVADLVKKSIAEDKERGNLYAEVLEGRITRKIVKQTVMTNVYGVTYVGAQAQVRKALTSLYSDLPNDESVHPGVLSAYIATKIFTALSNMFRGAHDIQYWLGECASRITLCVTPEQISRTVAEAGQKASLSKAKLASKRANKRASSNESLQFTDPSQFKSSVIWTNPLHMPVVQPYRKSKNRIIHTKMQQVTLSEPHRANPVSRRKQLQAFPPNFIHSLDASHMLLSALQCDELDLSFAAVHDSFWTHASDIDAMNAVLRDTFIRIHSEDVIGRLAAEFSARYRGSMYLAKVRAGTALHEKIMTLRQGSRKELPVRLFELMEERKRWQLLESSDPKEVEEGKRMVTPASLFAEMSAEGDLAPEDELLDFGLGEIPTRKALLEADQELEVGDESNIEEVNNPLPGGTPADLELEVDDESNIEEANNPGRLEDAVINHTSSGRVPRTDVNEGEKAEMTNFEKLTRSTRLKKPQTTKYTWAWLPLTFPPVPKKVSHCLQLIKFKKTNSLFLGRL